jgi:hypothetical protein
MPLFLVFIIFVTLNRPHCVTLNAFDDAVKGIVRPFKLEVEHGPNIYKGIKP